MNESAGQKADVLTNEQESWHIKQPVQFSERAIMLVSEVILIISNNNDSYHFGIGLY